MVKASAGASGYTRREKTTKQDDNDKQTAVDGASITPDKIRT